MLRTSLMAFEKEKSCLADLAPKSSVERQSNLASFWGRHLISLYFQRSSATHEENLFFLCFSKNSINLLTEAVNVMPLGRDYLPWAFGLNQKPRPV